MFSLAGFSLNLPTPSSLGASQAPQPRHPSPVRLRLPPSPARGEGSTALRRPVRQILPSPLQVTPFLLPLRERAPAGWRADEGWLQGEPRRTQGGRAAPPLPARWRSPPSPQGGRDNGAGTRWREGERGALPPPCGEGGPERSAGPGGGSAPAPPRPYLLSTMLVPRDS